MNIRQRLTAAAVILIVAGVSCKVLAADSSADAPVFVTADDKWSFEITPYAWLAGIKGDLNVRGNDVGIDQSFTDIVKALKFAADALAIARYNNWLIYAQLDYFSLSTDKLEHPPARGTLAMKQGFYTAAGGYRFNGWKPGQTFDVLIGAQGIVLDNTLSLYQRGRESNTRSALDAVFVLRPSFQLSQHWLFNPTISVGGGDSNSTYQLQPQFQYQFNSTWEIRFGYRKLHYKFTGDRDNTLDLNLSGPLIGFGATF
jgi:hypothetical protein